MSSVEHSLFLLSSLAPSSAMGIPYFLSSCFHSCTNVWLKRGLPSSAWPRQWVAQVRASDPSQACAILPHIDPTDESWKSRGSHGRLCLWAKSRQIEPLFSTFRTRAKGRGLTAGRHEPMWHPVTLKKSDVRKRRLYGEGWEMRNEFWWPSRLRCQF